MGPEPTVVEGLRDVGVDRRVHPPRGVKEDAETVVEGGRAAEQMLEGRHAGSFRVHALD